MQYPEEYAAEAERMIEMCNVDPVLMDQSHVVMSALAAANATLALVAIELRNNR